MKGRLGLWKELSVNIKVLRWCGHGKRMDVGRMTEKEYVSLGREK